MERLAVISVTGYELWTFQAVTEKTRLGCRRPRHIVTVVFMCLRSSLTYLLTKHSKDIAQWTTSIMLINDFKFHSLLRTLKKTQTIAKYTSDVGCVDRVLTEYYQELMQ